ncbi:MAG: tubulin-like doman-containing protein [Methanoregulaceae archaeon]
MKALLIGCGEGGSRLTEAIMKIQCATFGCDSNGKSIKKQFDAIVINTTNEDLKDIDRPETFINSRRKLLIGTGYSQTAGRGSGGNPRLGTLAAIHDRHRISAMVEEILSEINSNPEMNDIDAFFVISALGGGSGSGMGPVIAKILKDYYAEEQYPVIGIVTLPAKEEGQLPAYNAYVSLQSWLKESNFDGIITISLGGKFLNNRDESRKYYSKFNKSVATTLYILFGGEATGKKSTNIDMNDFLGTIREGGGLCTIGHYSMKIVTPTGVEKETSVLTHEDSSSLPQGWETEKLIKAVGKVCNCNNLFLPINFKSTRTALLVVKDSTTFKVPRGSAQEAANWLESKILGHVRYADINHAGFRLITDNTRGTFFDEEFEISPEDHILSRNESVEIVVLLAGIRNVQIVQQLREAAEKVFRFSNPPRGERLLAETLGLSIGEKIDETMLLPCSHDRSNGAAQAQSRATTEALTRFMADLMELDGDIPESKIRKSVKVVDVKVVPDDVTCHRPDSIRGRANCYKVSLVFENQIDGTSFKKDYVVRVIVNEEKRGEIGKRTTWEKSEFIMDRYGWNNRERQIFDDTLKRAVADGIPVLGISGIGPYPGCTGLTKKFVYRARVASSKGPVYYHWIYANPYPVVLSEGELQRVRMERTQSDYSEFFDILFEQENEVPSTERIEYLLRKLGVREERKDVT